jgi:hypothetical protein
LQPFSRFYPFIYKLNPNPNPQTPTFLLSK